MNAFLKRFPSVWAVRNKFRANFVAFLRHLAAIDESRQIFSDLLRLNNVSSFPSELSIIRNHYPPYHELCLKTDIVKTSHRDDIIFITGRFRSGSTLLWNIFRNIPSVTCYYEPFNERRWFDQSTRGTRVDSTHLHVSEYWAEYEDLEILSNYYDENWICKQLYMCSHNWNPSMQRYLEVMVERSKGRPVFQFNRIDLRLPWFREQFPGAKIVHIFRHPRDQWCSTLSNNISKFHKDSKLHDFESFDEYYLLTWGRDLRHYFPFLTLDEDSHPYELFYQIWKLSYNFGCVYSDLSISLEEILTKPESTIKNILTTLSIANFDLVKLVSLVQPIPTGKWKRYASHDWFVSIEGKVEETFHNYFRNMECQILSIPQSLY